MKKEKKRMFLIKTAYWLGIGADGLWALALLFPPLFGLLTGRPDFNPDLQFRLTMGIGGSLMTGWTLLLLWADNWCRFWIKKGYEHGSPGCRP